MSLSTLTDAAANDRDEYMRQLAACVNNRDEERTQAILGEIRAHGTADMLDHVMRAHAGDEPAILERAAVQASLASQGVALYVASSPALSCH